MTLWVSGDVGKRVPKGLRGKGMGGRQPAHAPLPHASWAGLIAEEDAARRLFVAGSEDEESEPREGGDEGSDNNDGSMGNNGGDGAGDGVPPGVGEGAPGTPGSGGGGGPAPGVPSGGPTPGGGGGPATERRGTGGQRLSDPSVGDESGDDEPRTGAGEEDKPAGGDKPKTDKKDKRGKKGKEGKKGKKRDKPPSGG